MTTSPTTFTKKIDRAGLIEIYEALNGIKGSMGHVIHNFTAASIRTKLEEYVKPIIEQKTDVEKKRPTEFIEQRENLLRSFSLTDAEGHPLVSQNQYVIDPSRRSQFEEAALALKEKHIEKITDYEETIKQVNDFLRGDVEVTFPALRLKLSWFKNTVNQDHLEALMDLIEVDIDLNGTEAAAATPAPAAAPAPSKKAEKKK
jgi:hypothetical protein